GVVGLAGARWAEKDLVGGHGLAPGAGAGGAVWTAGVEGCRRQVHDVVLVIGKLFIAQAVATLYTLGDVIGRGCRAVVQVPGIGTGVDVRLELGARIGGEPRRCARAIGILRPDHRLGEKTTVKRLDRKERVARPDSPCGEGDRQRRQRSFIDSAYRGLVGTGGRGVVVDLPDTVHRRVVDLVIGAVTSADLEQPVVTVTRVGSARLAACVVGRAGRCIHRDRVEFGRYRAEGDIWQRALQVLPNFGPVGLAAQRGHGIGDKLPLSLLRKIIQRWFSLETRHASA